MSRYFSRFPKIRYNNIPVTDITRRTNFVNSNLSDPFLFLPYTVKDREKPEDIAYYYYGSIEFTWLVLMTNNIIDPYNDWVMSEEVFNKYLIKKYATQSNAIGYDVINWTRNELITENIVYYYRYLGDQQGGGMEKISAESSHAVDDLGTYIPYRIHEYEEDLNENRREIKVVDKRYLSQIAREFKDIMNER